MYIKQDWLDAIDYVSKKQIVTEPLICAHFPLVELGDAFRYIENNKDTALKVIITV
jgi:L-iditol 2-dehydrogenase